ncbi:MAG: sigma-70 family RNA polymerase sigma factor [Clostridia bacterium]|nr:sigma-70 family RNA polymerase sigma factor [Clostridia bacterium]
MIVESFIAFINKIMLFSAYVNNASNFPKPLTSAQERECFDAFHKGDKNAKDKLISHNLRLVVHIVKKYSGSAESDDLISVGSIGLIKAVNTYEFDKNTQFSTYAAKCIENEILMLLRSNKKHMSVLSLSESLGKDKDNNDISLQDVIPNDSYDLQESVENAVLTEKFMNIIEKSLSHREYEIMTMRYGLNNTPAITQREIAKKLNISRSYISRLEKKSIDLIREKTKDENIFE